jgi:hypothetical protein
MSKLLKIICEKSILDIIFNYQIEHNVSGQCFEHTLLFCDYMRHSGIKCKTIAGVIHYFDEESQLNYLIVHCWCVDKDGAIIDPSIEYTNIAYPITYFETIADAFRVHETNIETKRYITKHTVYFDLTFKRAAKNFGMTTTYYKELSKHVSQIMRNLRAT